MAFQSRNIEHKALIGKRYEAPGDRLDYTEEMQLHGSYRASLLADAVAHNRQQYKQALAARGLPAKVATPPQFTDDHAAALDSIAALKAIHLREGRSPSCDSTIARLSDGLARSMKCARSIIDEVSDRRAQQMIKK